MTRNILIYLFLAFIWTAVTGSLNGLNFVFGLLLGYLAMAVSRPLLGTELYGHRLWAVLNLTVFFLGDLIRSSFRIARDVLTPRHRMQSGIIAVPLDLASDMEIMTFANLISLTPGTLSLDLSDDRRLLFIHMMNIDEQDVDSERRMLKQRLEARVRRAYGHPVAPDDRS